MAHVAPALLCSVEAFHSGSIQAVAGCWHIQMRQRLQLWRMILPVEVLKLLSPYQWCAGVGWFVQIQLGITIGHVVRGARCRCGDAEVGARAEVDRVVGAEALVEASSTVSGESHHTSSWCNDVEHVFRGCVRCRRKQRCSSKNCCHQEGVSWFVGPRNGAKQNARLIQSLSHELCMAGVFVLSAFVAALPRLR